MTVKRRAAATKFPNHLIFWHGKPRRLEAVPWGTARRDQAAPYARAAVTQGTQPWQAAAQKPRYSANRKCRGLARTGAPPWRGLVRTGGGLARTGGGLARTAADGQRRAAAHTCISRLPLQ